jgi:hypothetical protein
VAIRWPSGLNVMLASARERPFRVVSSGSDGADSHDLLIVPFRGQSLTIPADTPELLPLLADAGKYGLSVVDEPAASADLAGVVCPNCNEDDVSWLSVEDDSNIAHCDNCGSEFELDDHR